jgi:class 3 adenylate cyclase/tetratricopeptide (TPR) repeat protein
MLRCTACGTENPDHARFCLGCGAPLAAADVAGRREVRKVVTVLFSDLSGSTALGERLDPERLRNAMSTYFRAMKAVVERHGGSVEKFIGDAIMAVFGIPQVHEDDALRAVRAGVEMRAALAELGPRLGLGGDAALSARIGINTGEVVAGDPSRGQTLVTGDAVNVAARLEQAAAPGEILLGQSTWRLVRDAVLAEQTDPVMAKGKTDPVAAWRLLGIDPRGAGHARRSDTPMVGRQRELRLLESVYDGALEDRACQLFTILGVAGVGKSRLVREFIAKVGPEPLVLRGRCLPYGEGITYWPIAEVVRSAAGVTDEDSGDEVRDKLLTLLEATPERESIVERVSQAIGLSPAPASQDELFWGVRRFLESLAVDRPLVMVLDDIHWAEDTFLDLIEHLADGIRDVQLLILCVARPDLLDLRSTWAGGKLNATTVLVQPLAAEASDALVEAFPGGDALPASMRARIREAADGNPLFVEELLGMLVDDGRLRYDGSAWAVQGDVAMIEIPISVQALLAARLERLPAEERALAERASVVGRVFERAAVTELSPDAFRASVPTRLQGLVRKELIRQERTPGMAGDEAFRFRHLLIRDAAYEALPKAERADLHERFATWVEASTADRLGEYQEIVAYHLEQAVRYHLELGSIAGRGDVVARAGAHLEAAARRAVEKGDVTSAARLFTRALDLVPGSERDARLLVELAEAWLVAGAFDRAAPVIEEARAAAVASLDDGLLALVRLQDDSMKMFRRTGDPPMSEADLWALVETLERTGQPAAAARAVGILASTAWGKGKTTECLALLERSIAFATEAGDRRQVRDCETLGLVARSMGSTPHRHLLELLDPWLGGPRGAMHAHATGIAAISLAALGELDRARGLEAASIAELFELGRESTAVSGSMGWYVIERVAGNTLPAEAAVRAGYERLYAMGDKAYGCTLAAVLAHILVDKGDPEEALGYSDISERDSDRDDMANEIFWRTARARALAALGRHDEAQTFMARALALCQSAEWPDIHGDALVDQGTILEAGGDRDAARLAYLDAVERYRIKGGTLTVKRALDRAAMLER